MREVAIALAMFALLAACGDDATPTTTLAAAAAAPEAVETPADTDLPTRMIEDLVYHPGGEPFESRSGAIDVIAPIDAGAWPTVVVFHGDPRYATKDWHRPDAQLIAERGRVVFLPAWGQTDAGATEEMGVRAAWDLMVSELKCAVLFAHQHSQDHGGDASNITLYGLSAGGNAVLMAGLADAEPLETCAASGPAVAVQALVPIDADWTLGGGWDSELTADPEAFYSITPWRYLDGSQNLSIDVLVTEIVGSYTRTVGSDPTTSWLSYRHPDIDLVADLTARGFLDDGEFSLKETGEHGFQVLAEAGYDATFTVMPGASHANWGEEGTAVVVATVVAAGER